MAETETTGTATGEVTPPTTLYGQMRAAGFSHDEVKDLAPAEPGGLPTPKQEQAAEPPPPDVPAPPPRVPGTFNPEQEQNALRAADSIQDPEMRMKVKGHLKREYANDAIMDGITSKAREEGTRKAISSYTSAIQQLRDDPKMPLEQKRALVQMLTKTMWQDPRTDYGETRQHLEAAMQTMAFGENTMNLGSGYIDAAKAIADGRITSARQILQMENQGLLTAKGYGMILGRFNTLDKPDKALDTRREALALNHIKTIVMKNLDENSPIPGQRPTAKHYDMLDKATQAFYDSIEAAGDDRAAVRKAMSIDAVTSLVDDVYPWDQRHADAVSFGQQPTGITVPPTVGTSQRQQDAYKNIVGYPPTLTDKDGKSKQIPAANWQQAIEILRKTGNVEAFDKHFPGQNGARILKTIPYVEPPPGSTPPPVVQPAAGSGFWSTIGERLFPPRGAIAKAIAEPVDKAIAAGANAIVPPAQEVKK